MSVYSFSNNSAEQALPTEAVPGMSFDSRWEELFPFLVWEDSIFITCHQEAR